LIIAHRFNGGQQWQETQVLPMLSILSPQLVDTPDTTYEHPECLPYVAKLEGEMYPVRKNFASRLFASRLRPYRSLQEKMHRVNCLYGVEK
jgi:hypothetical protein